MNKMKLIFILIPAFSLCSCSVFMAAHQPDKKNLNFLKPEFTKVQSGQSLGSQSGLEKKMVSKSIFSIHSGYSKEAKVAELSSMVLQMFSPSECGKLPGTPIELMESGTDTSLRIIYDQSLRIQRVEIHQEGKINVIDIGNPGGARR